MAKNLNKKHRFEVYTKNGFKCVFCGLMFEVPKNWDKKTALHNGYQFLEIDHIKPLSKGGLDNIENKQPLCEKCNRKKSNKY